MASSPYALVTDQPVIRRAIRTALLPLLGPSVDRHLAVGTCLADLLTLDSAPQVAVLDTGAVDPEEVRRVREYSPRVGIVAWIRESTTLSTAVRWVQESDGVIEPSRQNDPDEVAGRIDGARAESLGSMVASSLNAALPERIVLFLEHLARIANPPVTVEEAASVYGASAETFRKHLREARLPPPANLIMWMRLFHATQLIEATDRTVENIALALGFPSRNALNNALRRYADVTPTDVRASGVSWLVQVFASAVYAEGPGGKIIRPEE